KTTIFTKRAYFLKQKKTLLSLFMVSAIFKRWISTPGTRFPRAVGEPPRRLRTCGVSPLTRFSLRSPAPSVPIIFVLILR
ncbi:hypothetical protein, partial [Peribacillus frigoritolerans]|uniref:hypothetical protein n=1 Tax=Peribacillus frigoritolerans TaxID=450367 RepID=UPI00227E2A79